MHSKFFRNIWKESWSRCAIPKDVELAVFLYENEDHTFKVSFRVNGAFDAASLAMHFGGGGHVKAAGCTVEGPAEEAIERILAEVEKRL